MKMFENKRGNLRGQAAIERNSSAAGIRRGQAAMEYLMTYGWAILIIVVVLAMLLFYLPQFLRAPESCIFAQAGFTCSDLRPTIYIPAGEDQVYLAINVFNGQGKSINVHGVLCTSGAIGDVSGEDAIPDSASISAGGTHIFDVGCTDSRGNKLQLSSGNDFRGSFVIWYNFVDDVRPDIARQTHAVVSGPVLAEE